MLNNKILINIASLGTATLINAVLAFVLGIVTRNILGPEQFGYWLTVSLIFTFIPLFQLGTFNAMNREIPFFLVRKDYKRVIEIRETVFSFIFTIPLLLVLLLIVSSLITFFTQIKIEYKMGLLLGSIISGFTYLSGYVDMYYKSEQNFKRASTLISIKSMSQTIITVILVFFYGYIGLYLGMLFSLLIHTFMGKKVFPKIKSLHTIYEYKRLVKIGFPILIVGIIWSIMIAIDRIIISIFMTPKDLGNYGVGMMVFSTMMLFPQVISQVMYPKIVELVSIGDYSKIKRLYWKVNTILAISMIFVMIIGYILLPYFITWYMPEYNDGIRAAQLLLMGLYPLTLVNLAAAYFNSTDNQKVYMAIQVVSILINIALSIVFLYFNKSITSVAIATSISFIIYSILMNTVFLLKIKGK
ncbi:lipopolysaccharide biosynthesis protein [Psychrobacillus soli]|nr:oligosaccharide flippase family protein [Psychrobacillus soli]